MTTVQVVEQVAASANGVWGILGDFGGVKVGGPVEAVEVEGEGVGAIRTITMNGAKIVERLEAHDEASLAFTYAIINEDHPLPVSNYSATVKITADGENACSVDWTRTFEPRGADEETASNLVRGIYAGGIEGARRALTG